MSLARGGNNYPIHARDISHKAEVSETWTQFGAEQACRRLSVTFEAVANQQDAVRAVIEQRADAEREAIWARQARAEQQVSPNRPTEVSAHPVSILVAYFWPWLPRLVARRSESVCQENDSVRW